MRVLALDTTTRAGSVALVEDDRVVDERGGDPSRTHAERLPGEILALLADHGLAARRHRSVRRRVGSRLVHRPARSASRRFRAWRSCTAGGSPRCRRSRRSRSRPAAIVPAGALRRRVDGRASPRCVQRAVSRRRRRRRSRRRGCVEIDGPAVGDPAATLARWRAAGRRRSRSCSSATAPCMYGDLDRAQRPDARVVAAAAARRRHRTDGASMRASGRDDRAGRRAAVVRAAAGRRGRPGETKHYREDARTGTPAL